MADIEDPYATLGVARDARPDEIRGAFRRLARRYHPDVAGDVETAQRMAIINRAYALLSDPVRRHQYDLAHGPSAAAAPKPPAAAVAPDEVAYATPVWSTDLDAHAEDWRQALEEERRIWEQLLLANPGSASRAEFERELGKARRAQLDLENTLRQRAGREPLTAEQFEQRRTREREQVRQLSRTGCLLMACSGIALAVIARTLSTKLVSRCLA